MEDDIRSLALAFAADAHKGQTRKFTGVPYITHPIAVAQIALDMFVEKNPELADDKQFLDDIYVIALLHDVIEDTDVQYEAIEKLFGHYVADVVLQLTRQPGMSYVEYIKHIKSDYDPIPTFVKRADLTHNMSDLKPGTLKDKYELAYELLEL